MNDGMALEALLRCGPDGDFSFAVSCGHESGIIPICPCQIEEVLAMHQVELACEGCSCVLTPLDGLISFRFEGRGTMEFTMPTAHFALLSKNLGLSAERSG